MERDEAEQLLREHVSNKNLIKHCLAVEAIMGKLANYLNRKGSGCDFHKWRISGLLHDIDYDKTSDNPEQHSIMGANILESKGLDPDIVYAVRAHNQMHGLPLNSDMDIALYSADPLSGLIVASALISPKKKLKAIDCQFILNRFHEKAFARGADREQIKQSSRLGLSTKDFIALGLESMQEIDKQLGL